MEGPSTSSNDGHKTKYSLRCFVPMCPSTSSKLPNKLFLCLPTDPKKREQWMKAAKRDPNYAPSGNWSRCCEDHFNMENDIENWAKYKYMGGRLFLKKGVIPHIFNCQQKVTPSKTPAVLKRHRHETYTYSNEAPALGPVLYEKTVPSKDKCIQVAIYPSKRSKQVQGNIVTPTTTVALSPIKTPVKNQMTSPIKIQRCPIYSDTDSDESDFVVETGCTPESVLSEINSEQRKKLTLELTMEKIRTQPKLYIGVPQDSIILLDLLQKSIQIPLVHACLVLKKLRLNEPFAILANDFGMHESTASRIFSTVCPKIARALKTFIIRPSQLSVLGNLPIAFRGTYSTAYCIIDCLEIEIEVPTNALHQSLTYSSYKKCNTIKYLISATPDGVINFVSEGFGGRTSDMTICLESTFFDCLPPGASIMADRGFKHIEGELRKRNLQLIRPPSVSSTAKSSKEEVLQSKKIASLRIHIERVIRRLREFSFLKPHACIDHNLIASLDSAIIICCSLTNLQPPLIQ